MDLYQELILEHSKRPVRAGLREPFDAQVHRVNTTCGDEVTLRVRLEGDRVVDVSYDALGCSISIAAASILAEQITGATVAHSMDVYEATKAMLTSRGTIAGNEEVIGDSVALAGVSKYPARVKCALLPWTAYTAALAESLPEDSAHGILDSPALNTSITHATGGRP